MSRGTSSSTGRSAGAPRSQGKPPVHIRRASAGDLSFVLCLADRVFKKYGPYSQILLMAYFQSEVTTLVAWLEMKRVGFAMLSPARSSRKEIELSAIAVVPDLQGRGIGAALLREAVHKAAVQDVRGVVLHTAETNSAARRLFLKEGFETQESVRQYYQHGQNALRMYLPLRK